MANENTNPAESSEESPAQTMLSIMQLLGQLCQIYQKQVPETLPIDLLQMSHTFDLFFKIYTKHGRNPHKLFELQQTYMQELTNIFASFESDVSKSKKDKEIFKNSVWRENVYFDFLKKTYYLTEKTAKSWLRSLDDLDIKTKQQLHFYVENFLTFASPTNQVWTNPEVLEAVVQTGGKNLLRGFRNYLEDLVLNDGKTNVRMTDLKAFEVGRNLATTPGKVVFQNDLMQLIQYTATTEQVHSIPILFIPPWINKYYVLDLSEKNSLVKWLVAQGYTVFMISWVNPDADLAEKTFDDYMLEGPVKALDVITKSLDCDKVDLVGYCIGGTLLACTLAYLKATRNTQVNTATFFMSLLNFSNPGELRVFLDDRQVDALEDLMRSQGYLNGHLLEMAFNLLRPNDLIWPYYVNRYLLGKSPKPFDLLYWNADSSNLAYKMYIFYLRNMYLHNKLAQPGAITLNNVPIDLGAIDIPTLFVGSETDHITLWRSVYSGLALLNGPLEFILSESGHVRGVVNPPKDDKYGYRINKNFTQAHDYKGNAKEWVAGSTRVDGSWWSHWEGWIEQHNSIMIPARSINQSMVIEDAPGSYVLKRI